MVKSVEKIFENVKFSPNCLKDCKRLLEGTLDKSEQLKFVSARLVIGRMKYSYNNAPSEEAQFFDRYAEEVDSAYFIYEDTKRTVTFDVSYLKLPHSSQTRVELTLPDLTRIQEVFGLLDEAVINSEERFEEANQLQLRPKIFLGHGRSQLWRDLRDHLRDQHGYIVEAFETGARAGHTIRDIVEEMARKSDVAFLVHTAEDEQKDGTFHSRPNVIHETGLFQGKLGFSRAIVLLENGCEEFSNLAGIQQIRFSKGNIREAFGDVLATLRREFGEHQDHSS